jgi:hypothetical protein
MRPLPRADTPLTSAPAVKAPSAVDPVATARAGERGATSAGAGRAEASAGAGAPRIATARQKQVKARQGAASNRAEAAADETAPQLTSPVRMLRQLQPWTRPHALLATQRQQCP